MELLAGVFIASCITWESESLVAGSCNSDKLSCYIRTFQKTKTFLIFHSYHLEFKPAALCNFLYSQDWTHCQSALHSLQTITCCNLYSQINAILFSIQWAGLHHFPFVFILRSSFRVAPYYWDGTSISGEFLKYQSIFKLLSWQRACPAKRAEVFGMDKRRYCLCHANGFSLRVARMIRRSDPAIPTPAEGLKTLSSVTN